uniref:Uncharacterized protein n=1 Tax=Steinernema glaseri TaxID=37863 RepID=A0A1I7YBD2_9BILA
MKRLLLLSLVSSCFGTTYVQNLPTGTVVFGTVGEVLISKFHPRDCVLAWKEGSVLPKTFVYNSLKKTCTFLTLVLGTKKASTGEEAYFIESSEDVCKRNFTEAVEDITEAPWSQEVVIIREPEAMVHYNSKATFKKVYRNHRFYELGNGSSINLSCNDGEKHCLCNEALDCGKFSLTSKHIILRGECNGEGRCGVNSYDRWTKKLLHSNTHYVSCGKCADEIKLDTSPPRDPCLPRIEDVEKSKPIGVCDVDQKKVMNKLQVDYLLPYAPTTSEDTAIQAKNDKFYTAEGLFFLQQYCGKDGKCTIMAEDGTMTPVNGGKTYTEVAQKIGDERKPFDDTDAYLRDIVSVTEGSCPPKKCVN